MLAGMLQGLSNRSISGQGEAPLVPYGVGGALFQEVHIFFIPLLGIQPQPLTSYPPKSTDYLKPLDGLRPFTYTGLRTARRTVVSAHVKGMGGVHQL